MTGPNKEDMQDLNEVISHLESRTEKFKELKRILRDMRAEEMEVYLDAPPDSFVVQARAVKKHKPTGLLLELQELSDSNPDITYEPEGDKYSVSARFNVDR